RRPGPGICSAPTTSRRCCVTRTPSSPRRVEINSGSSDYWRGGCRLMESTDLMSPEPPSSKSPGDRERVGPGGAPVIPDEPPSAPPGGAGSRTDVVLDCGWGRLVFGQTFADPSKVADVLRSEATGARDICIYLPDPHVL